MRKILVVDDDPSVRGLVRDVLECEGYVVGTAENGASALLAVAAERPDCVVLDIMMPGLDGHAVLARLRAHDDSERLLPVIMLTAAADDAHAWEAYRGGVDYFLAKPFDASELLRCLDSIFEDAEAAAG